jgi:putative methyltransferase (TIGR04325 family)
MNFLKPFIDRLYGIARPAETLDGYENPELIEMVYQKTLAYKPVGTWPDMVGASSVLDFGGACGLHYKMATQRSPGIRWAVVETPAMVARASGLATDKLRFFTDIADAADWLGPIDVMHSNGALLYVPDPMSTLSRLCRLGAPTMLWERMNLSRHRTEVKTQISRLTDNGPGRAPRGSANKLVRYTVTRIPESTFIKCHVGYLLESSGNGKYRFVLAPD